MTVAAALPLFLLVAVMPSPHAARADEHEPKPTEQPAYAQKQQTDNQLRDLVSVQAKIVEAISRIQQQQAATQEQDRADHESLLSPLRLQKGLLIIGLLYTIFAACQWVAVRRQARIAVDALKASRPIIEVRDPVLQGFDPRLAPPSPESVKPNQARADLIIENCGMSPARLSAAMGALVLLPKSVLPKLGDFTQCDVLQLPKIVLRPGDSQTVSVFYQAGQVTPEEHIEIVDDHSWFVLYGFITYQGPVSIKVHDKKGDRADPTTPFLWIYYLQFLPGGHIKGNFYRRLDEYNRSS
jgi:hypothetical protein